MRRALTAIGGLILLIVIALGLFDAARSTTAPRRKQLPPHVPRWGDVALRGAVVLFQREKGRESLQVLYSGRRGGPELPKAFQLGRPKAMESRVCDKLIIGRLYGRFLKLGLFKEAPSKEFPSSGDIVELTVFATGKSFRLFGPRPLQQPLGDSVAAFHQSFAAAGAAHKASSRPAAASKPTTRPGK